MSLWFVTLVGTATCLCVFQLNPVAAFVIGGGSCSGRCGDHPDFSQVCQCNTFCLDYQDCCSDYLTLCTAGSSGSDTCKGRCNAYLDKHRNCQCNSACVSHHNCCPDYHDVCTGGSNGHVNTGGSVDTSSIVDVLWQKDVNRFPDSDITYNPQGHTSSGASSDKASEPLFSHVNEQLFSKPTYEAFIALFDNYNPNKGQADQPTSSEVAEENAFLDAILQTDVMQTTLKFLQDNNIFTGSQAEFKNKLQELWFHPYARSGHGSADSSGFEHDFVGEFKGSGIGGFHNWVRFYLEEKSGYVNYKGYMKKENPNILEFTHTWHGHKKPINSFFIGTSPEFDLAISTICILSHPNHQCSFSVQGTPFKMQAWTDSHSSETLVGTVYPIF